MWQYLRKNINNTLLLFPTMLVALFLTLFMMRGIDFVIDTERQLVIGLAIWADLVFFLKLVPVLFCCLVLVSFSRKLDAQTKFFIIGSIWLLIYSALMVYFMTTKVPLGADMFGYSVKDSLRIISESLTFDILLISIFILPIIIFWFLLKVFKPIGWNPIYTLIIIVGGIILLLFNISAQPDLSGYKNEYAYTATQNKGAFFIESLGDYFSELSSLDSEGEVVTKYLDPEFPFYRLENTQDVLSDFFKVDTIKPNFVFIQVEGLGRAFSGPKAYLGSFTPFLDELAKKSMYFENFLSSQGRTFAALPSILGSLPFAETGFSDLENQMPKFNSLISIANANGYETTYYGGFEMNFDHQGLFMKKAGIKKIISAIDFDKTLTMASPIGYSDGDLMEKALHSGTGSKPSFSFIQTISMHNPFTVPDQVKYLSMVETHMNSLGFNEDRKRKTRAYKNIFASILYTDQALRTYFESYSKLPAFRNTIFIITGDHRLPEIPLSTKIDRYHVPLIIYSPMLRSSVNISAISSHFDLAPSIVVFLKNSYHMKTPDKVTWVGTGLDVNKSFRNIHEYPLKQGKTVLHNYIKGLYFLDGGQLFSINPGLDIEPIVDNKLLNKLKAGLNQYKLKNESFLKSKKLMPDS